MAARRNLTQRNRVVISLVYVAVLVVLSALLTGDAFPPMNAQGVWFYAGVATLLLSTAVAEPFFTRPADALINGVAVLIVAVSFPTEAGAESGASAEAITLGKVITSAYGLFVIALALLAMFTLRSDSPSKISGFATRLVGEVGSARVLYSIVFLGSTYGVYSRDPAVAGALFGRG